MPRKVDMDAIRAKMASKIAAKRKALATEGKGARESKKLQAQNEVDRLRLVNEKQEKEIADLKLKEEALEALVNESKVPLSLIEKCTDTNFKKKSKTY